MRYAYTPPHFKKLMMTNVGNYFENTCDDKRTKLFLKHMFKIKWLVPSRVELMI